MLSSDLYIKDRFSSCFKLGLKEPDLTFNLFAISTRFVGPFNNDININLFLYDNPYQIFIKFAEICSIDSLNSRVIKSDVNSIFSESIFAKLFIYGIPLV